MKRFNKIFGALLWALLFTCTSSHAQAQDACDAIMGMIGHMGFPR